MGDWFQDCRGHQMKGICKVSRFYPRKFRYYWPHADLDGIRQNGLQRIKNNCVTPSITLNWACPPFRTVSEKKFSVQSSQAKQAPEWHVTGLTSLSPMLFRDKGLLQRQKTVNWLCTMWNWLHIAQIAIAFDASRVHAQFDGIRQNGLWWPNPCSTSLNSVLILINSTQIHRRMAMASEWERTFSSNKYLYFSPQASASPNWWHQAKWLAQASLSAMRTGLSRDF